ncbi:MAG TPA: YciI family protein [Flavisolibacter sp.]|nr:YciI family protein [Flavisolibacter sp.]
MSSRNTTRFLLLPILGLMMTNYSTAQTQNPKYDKALADSLGADDYGMKMYVLVILKSGPVIIENKKTTDSLFVGHLKNIQRLANEGKLVVAGPLQKNEKSYRGIFILNVKTTEEAKTLLQTDPAIKAQLLDSELFEWYGSAALPVYLPASEKVGRLGF